MSDETRTGGKYLRVDLSSPPDRPRIWTDRVDEATQRAYPGGSAYGARVLYDEVPPGVEWSDPENRLIVASGPLGGTRVGGSGTISVVTVGPLTGGAASSQANGFLGAYMRLNGYDGVVVQGAAETLQYLYIHDGEAELRDATHLAGVDTWEIIDCLADELGVDERRIGVFGIGPAGENLVRFAAVVGDRGHVAGHNGTGAVMGSKRLKAIVAQRAPGTVAVHDREALSDAAGRLYDRIAHDPAAREGVFRWGTLRGVARGAQGGGWLPVKNYTTNVYNIPDEVIETWDGPYLQERYVSGRHNCWACRFQHCTTFTIPDGPHAGYVGEEPEYEQFAAFGPVIGNTDVAAAVYLANECDRLGFENNEMGWVIGLAMECYEKGVLSREQLGGLDLRWGNVEAVHELMRKIAHRDGAVGDLLAQGVKGAAEQIGGEALHFAIHTAKGNTPRGHDHRARWTEMFDTATSNTGTMETGPMINMPRDAMDAIGVKGPPDMFDGQQVSAFNARTKGAMLFEDSLGVCRFNTRTDVPHLAQALNAATGWDVDPEEAMQIGRRAANLFRAFNLRHGIDPALDAPSLRYGSTPLDGSATGVSVQPAWDDMLANYYRLLGWDERGVPTRQTLEALGIGEVADDLGV